MSHILKTVARLCFFLWFLSGSNAVADNPLLLTEEEQDWIKSHPVVTVANEMGWPPFDYVVDGKPAGYSIDLIRLIKQKTGLQIKFINGFTWQELLQQFQAGDIDIMPAIYVNEERSKYTLFTRSYFSQPSVMVVHKDNKAIRDIASLTGRRVAGILDFAITNTLKEAVPNITIVPVDNILEGLKAVSLGKADAFIDSIGTVSYNLEHNYIPNLKVIGNFADDTLTNPSLHLGVATDKPVLRSILDKALSAISRKEKQTLEKRWIHISESITQQNVSNRIILTPEQKAWLTEHPVIRIGIDPGYAPYSFKDTDGTFIGVAPDFISLISDKLGISFETIPDLTWPQILQGAREHTLDVIATAAITEDRNAFLNFTQIYIPTPLVIMSLVDDNRINNAADLDGLTVALVEDYSSSKNVIDEHPTAKIVYVSNPVEGLHAVSSGKVDAYVGVIGINIYQAQKQGITNLKISANYDVVNNGQRFAVRSDWTELVQILQRALNSIKEEERKAIYNKWINVPYVEQVDYSLLWKSLIVFLAIISLMYLYNRQLSREVSRRQAVEQQLLELNESLAIARDEANKANQAKSEFLSSMNHELRTPMNAIMGYSQLLEMNLKDEKDRNNANEILSAGHHLLNLINEVLDLSKIEAGKIDINKTDVSLNQVINENLSLIGIHANKRNIVIINNICHDSDFTLYADYTRLKQVLLNLLSNAVKYNVENGQITLNCNEITNNHIRIIITDTGKGLTTEEQQELFKPFKRIGTEYAETEGTGIGLVISKQLIEKMGGHIGYSSQVGQGSSFWVEMPLSSKQN